MAGIAGASASEVGTAQTQSVNSSTVQEKANIQTNNTYNANGSATTQNSADNSVKSVGNTSTATSDTSINETTVKTQAIVQDTATPTATSNVNSQNSACTETNTQTAISTADANQNSVTSSKNTANNTNNTQTQEALENQGFSVPQIENLQAAAGEAKTVSSTSTVTSTSFTVSQINDAAARVKAFIETNHKLPNYVTVGTVQVKMPDFLKLLTSGLLKINSGSTTSVTLENVNTPTQTSESIKSGNITKVGYIDLAKRVNSFIDANGVLPNYATSTLGKLNYQSMIYMFSKILAYEKTNNRLPNYVSVAPWSTISSGIGGSTSTPVPAELQQYLKATSNCQVNDPKIKALAASITAGKTSTYDKAVAIFNWVRDNLSYSFYYNTKYGAVGALNAKTGNCVDTAHLLVALSRAAGIPAKYEHVNAKFTSGNWYGHVIALVWVNGKWYRADATSSSNTFGVIKNWNVATATLKGTYASLPF